MCQRQAGTESAEITPEMIKAAERLFWQWRGENYDGIVMYDHPVDVKSLLSRFVEVYESLKV